MSLYESLNMKQKTKKYKSFYFAETSLVESDAEIGDGTVIWHYSHIREGAKIGKNCMIGSYVEIGKDVKIGDDCRIQNLAQIYEGTTLEDKVFVGPGVIFTNDKYPRAYTKTKLKGAYIKTGVSIGAGSIILPEILIGDYSMIGAGSIITMNVPPYTVMAGNPAKVIGKIDTKRKITKLK